MLIPLLSQMIQKNLEILVTGKAKTAIEELICSFAMYKDALDTLQRKIGQPQAIAGAQSDKLSIFH